LHNYISWAANNNQTLRKRMASTEFVHEHEPPANIALQTAAMRGDIEGLRKLVGQGVDVNFREPLKSTALNIAADYGQLAAVELLLAAGADADARDDNHESALFTAAAHGRQRIARALLDAGAAADVGGYRTPFRVALFYGRRSVLKVLLRAGSDIETRFVDRDASNEDAWALVDALAGDWSAYARAYRAVRERFVAKCIQPRLPAALAPDIAAFASPPGGW
jgi:hypothetical protein